MTVESLANDRSGSHNILTDFGDLFLEETIVIPQYPIAPRMWHGMLMAVRNGDVTLEELAAYPQMLAGEHMDYVRDGVAVQHGLLELETPSDDALRMAAGFVTVRMFQVAAQLGRANANAEVDPVPGLIRPRYGETDLDLMADVADGIAWLRESEANLTAMIELCAVAAEVVDAAEDDGITSGYRDRLLAAAHTYNPLIQDALAAQDLGTAGLFMGKKQEAKDAQRRLLAERLVSRMIIGLVMAGDDGRVHGLSRQQLRAAAIDIVQLYPEGDWFENKLPRPIPVIE